MRAIPLLALALTVAACDTAGLPPLAQVEGSDPIRLAVGESGVVDGVAVTFAALVDDSRCPPDMYCIWEGRVVVALQVDGTRHEVETVDLEAGPLSDEVLAARGIRVGDRIVLAVALDYADGEAVVAVATVAAE